MVTVSPRSSRMIASRLCSMRGRCSSAGIPSMWASDVSCPGPQPSMTRPRVRWSSSTMRSASINGLWYGSELTPVPSLMCLVRSAATAMNTSGEAMISNPAEWCSPIHASWNPSSSIAAISSRSRSMASVGFCPVGWKGAMKIPNRIRSFWTWRRDSRQQVWQWRIERTRSRLCRPIRSTIDTGARSRSRLESPRRSA